MEPITKTIALYRHIKFDYLCMYEADEYQERDKDYVRITELLPVTFTVRAEAEVQTKILAQLLVELDKAQSDHESAMQSLHDRIDQLRALPAPQEAA